MHDYFDRIKEHFDAESCKVYCAAITGTALANWIESHFIGILTGIYITIKISKQIRDWSKSDKD